MKFCVEGVVYDANEQPLVLILTEEDKKNIANMVPEATRICVWPEDCFTQEEIHETLSTYRSIDP